MSVEFCIVVKTGPYRVAQIGNNHANKEDKIANKKLNDIC